MSKRTPGKGSKHLRRPKIAAKAQQASQAIVKSPKESRLRTARAAESPRERTNDSMREAVLVENPATTLQDDRKHTMKDNDSSKEFDLSLTPAWAFQAKLLEMTQANMQLAFEFARKFATLSRF